MPNTATNNEERKAIESGYKYVRLVSLGPDKAETFGCKPGRYLVFTDDVNIRLIKDRKVRAAQTFYTVGDSNTSPLDERHYDLAENAMEAAREIAEGNDVVVYVKRHRYDDVNGVYDLDAVFEVVEATVYNS